MDDDVPVSIAGLRNIGNTCFLAAALQVLASSPLVLQQLESDGPCRAGAASSAPASNSGAFGWIAAAAKGLIEAVYGSDSPSDEDAAIAAAAHGRLTQQLLICLRALQPRPATSTSAVDPSGVRAALTGHLPDGEMAWGMQHDSSEALEALCNAAELERSCWELLQRKAPRPRPPGLGALLVAEGPSSSCIFPAGAGEEAAAAAAGAAASRGEGGGSGVEGGAPPVRLWRQAALPLQGMLTDEVTCLTCSSSYRTAWALFYVLHLPLPTSLGVTGGGSSTVRVSALADLAAALRQFFRPEILGGVECARCGLRASVEAAAAAGNEQNGGSSSSSRAGTPGPRAWSPEMVQRSLPPSNKPGAGVLQKEASPQQRSPSRSPSPTRQNGGQQQANGQEKPANEQQQQGQQQQQQQQEGQRPGDTPRFTAAEMRRIAACSGPLPPFDLEAAAIAAGLPWTRSRKRVVRSTRLARAPPVVALHLQRTVHTATGGLRKLQGHVAFPLAIDLTGYLAGCDAGGTHHPYDVQWSSGGYTGGCTGGGSSGSGSDRRGRRPRGAGSGYRLAAVVEHLGASTGWGHYVVYRRVKRGGCSPDGASHPTPQHQQWKEEEKAAQQQQLGDGQWQGPGQRLRCSLQQPPTAGAGAPQGSGPTTNDSSSSSSSSGGDVWLRLSDASVSVVTAEEVLACDATLLLYERR